MPAAICSPRHADVILPPEQELFLLILFPILLRLPTRKP
jgi:hypothetical protein